MKTYPIRRRQRAFTLVEVLLVLVILVTIGSLAVAAYAPIQRKASINAAKAQIKTLETTLRFYRADLDDYPTTQQGLEALNQAPAELADPSRWRGPYLEDPVPVDPWGNPFQYESPGQYSETKPDIWSLGPDGVNGSEDDVANWSAG